MKHNFLVGLAEGGFVLCKNSLGFLLLYYLLIHKPLILVWG